MADSKMVPSNDGKIRAENIHVQVTMVLLTKDNYLTWFAAITINIAGQGKYVYIAGLIPPLARTDLYGHPDFLNIISEDVDCQFSFS